jgi:hypothetical protein
MPANVRAGWAPPSKPARRTLPLIVVVLTFTSGVVDAVSYLGLGRVFAGLQTGNVVVLGFTLAGTEGFSVAPPAVSLASFFVGAWLRGRLAAHLSRRHRRWFSLALSIEALLVAVAAAAAAGLPTDVATARRLAGHRVAGRRDGPPDRHGTPTGGAQGHDRGCDPTIPRWPPTRQCGAQDSHGVCGDSPPSRQARWRGRGRTPCTSLAVRPVSAGCFTDRSRGRRLSGSGHRPRPAPQPVSRAAGQRVVTARFRLMSPVACSNCPRRTRRSRGDTPRPARPVATGGWRRE